jgi:hypothetical protein
MHVAAWQTNYISETGNHTGYNAMAEAIDVRLFRAGSAR